MGSRGGQAWPNARLEAALAGLALAVDFPETADLAGVVGARIRQAPLPVRRPWLGWLGGLRQRSMWRPVVRRPVYPRVAVAAAALVTMFAGTLVFSPSARDAVAGWIGLRGAKILVVPTVTPLPSPPIGRGLDLGYPVSLAEARREVPYGVVVPKDAILGDPDEVYVRTGFITDQVSLVYRSRPGFPPASLTGAAVLMSEFQGRTDEGFLEKTIVGTRTTLEAVTVGGEPGFWLAGEPHQLTYIDSKGRPVGDRVRLAGNVLLWQRGSLTLRLEGGPTFTKEQALAIAESVA
jgi:hypothetical protein